MGGGGFNHNNRFVDIANRLQRRKGKKLFVYRSVFMSHALCSSENIDGSAQLQELLYRLFPPYLKLHNTTKVHLPAY